MPEWLTVRRWLIGILLATNVVLARWLGARPSLDPELVMLALTPLAVVLVLILQPRLRPIVTPVLVIVLGAAMLRTADFLGTHIPLYYLAQHVAVHAALAVFFLGSLRGGRQPLCTRLAAQTHDHISPALQRYTRQVTWAWGLFFVVNGTVSVLLMMAFGPDVWSTYAVYATFPLVATMFVVEYLARLWVLPRGDWTSPLSAIRAYRRHMVQLAGDRK